MNNVDLYIDLGNSETKVFAVLRSVDNTVASTKSFILDNRFVAGKSDSFIESSLDTDDYDNATSTAIRLDMPRDGLKLQGNFLSGVYARDNLRKLLIEPANLPVDKADNIFMHLAVINALDKVIGWVSEISPTNFSKSVVAGSLRFSLHLLVPPAQVATARVRFSEVYSDGVSYYDYFSKSDINVSISEVEVGEEGFFSYWSYLVSYSNLSVRAESAFLAKETVLLLDIGEGTTNILGVSSNSKIDSMKYTIMTGSNRIMKRVMKSFNKDNKTNLPSDSFKHILEKPVVHIGSTEYDVSGYIAEEIEDTASLIANEVASYISGSDIDLSYFRYLIVVGGGALSNGKNRSLAEAVLDSLRVFIPSISLVSSEHIVEPKLEGSEVDLTNPRNLSLLGLVIKDSLVKARSVS